MIIKNPNIYCGKGSELNVVFSDTQPDKTDSLWIKATSKDYLWVSPQIMSSYSVTMDIGQITTLKRFGLCDCGDYVYVVGGLDEKSNFKETIYKYNKNTNTCVLLKNSLYEPQCNMVCERVGNKIYIIGGQRSGSSNLNIKDITVLDTTNDTLLRYENVLTVPVINSGSVVKGDNIYLVSGANAKTSYDIQQGYCERKIYEYNTKTNNFRYLFDIAENNIDFACVLYGDDIYMLGGTKSKKIYKISLTDYSSQLMGTLPVNFVGRSAVCLIDSDIYMLYDGLLIKYSIESNVAEVIKTLNKKMSHSGLCALPNNEGLYIFLGDENSSVNKVVFTHTLIKDVVHIRTGSSTKKFNLISTYNTMVTLGVCDVFIGNSNDIAEKAEAYVYDTDSQSWVKV